MKRAYRAVPADRPGTITCRICQVERPVDDFMVRASAVTGHPGWRRTECKYCQRERARRSGKQVKQGNERWLTRRNGILQRKYGITNEDFDRMARHQKGRCLICNKVPRVRRRGNGDMEWTALHVDHCHTTGRVRGLLCMRCNTAIGWLESLSGGLDAIRSYLLSR